ncbi:MAG: CBS domain-containing protein [Planctomycetia bacterium]|jgi:CBS domain-containing protein
MTTVEDILMVKGPDVIVASPTTTVLEAARLMAEDDVGSIIVRDDDSNVLGIFTERDLLRRVVAPGKDPTQLIMTDIMSSPVKSCSLTDSIHHCANILATSKIRHLAVIEEDALVGMIGLRDLFFDQVESMSAADITNG